MLVDIHAHAAGEYGTADSIKRMAEIILINDEGCIFQPA